MTTEGQIRKLAQDVGLSAHADSIIKLGQPAIRIQSSRAAESEIPVGASKMGGSPDLPPDFEWPRWHGTPLTFLTQFNLADVVGMDAARDLPSDGLLAFFYEAYEKRWGFDPDDRGAARVFYFADTTTLQRFDHPAAKVNGRWVLPRNACKGTFAAELSLPDESIASESLNFTDDEADAYLELTDTLYERAEAIATHRLLGHPDLIQGDMRYEAQMASNGLYWGDDRHADDPRVAELEPGVDDWRLLLQLDSDENLDVKWFGNGMIYFWIKQTDLTARRFEEVWLILQTY